MPAYNCEAYVAEAIESILNQTFNDWELLVADDGSTDRTREIIDHYTDPRVRRLHNANNQGLVETWNKLLRHAHGEFLLWQDADDISYPHRIEILLEMLRAKPNVLMCGSNAVRTFSRGHREMIISYPTSHEEICKLFEDQRPAFLGSTRMVRRSALKLVDGFRPFFNRIGGEDLDFALRLSEVGRIENLPEVLYVYRYNPSSNSRTFVKEHYLKLFNEEIAFFLAAQRRENQGLDGLMQGGNYQQLEHFLTLLRTRYLKDPSVVYRRAAVNQISNHDFASAITSIGSSIYTNPLHAPNYETVFYLVRGIVGAAVSRLSN